MLEKIWCKSNLITFLGIAFAVSGMWFCYVDKMDYAIISLMISGVCDAFDGFFARKMGQNNKEYGIQLDSLADIITSGVLPVIICLSLGFKKIYYIPVYILFLVCGVTRLAYYNVNSNDKEHFSGIPITCSTMLIPLIYLITKIEYIYMIALTLISIFFVLDIKIRKPTLKLRIILTIIGIVFSLAIVLR